jgi:hypothetical protein
MRLAKDRCEELDFARGSKPSVDAEVKADLSQSEQERSAYAPHS